MKINTSAMSANIKRARSCAGKKTVYVLGAGGGDPSQPLGRRSDCTGYIAWVLCLRRDQRRKWGMWIESTNIVADAKGAQKLFTRIAQPVPGCVVAYPDSFIRRLGRLFKTGEGHAAIVTAVNDADGSFSGVDCSNGQYKRRGDAITERELTWMRKRGAVFMVLTQDVER